MDSGRDTALFTLYLKAICRRTLPYIHRALCFLKWKLTS